MKWFQIDLLEENTSKYLHNLGVKSLLNVDYPESTKEREPVRFDGIKIKTFCVTKGTV